MKSTRRHELKQNTLDAELGKFVGFLKRRGNLIAWVALIVALIILASVYFYKKHAANQENMLAQYDLLVRSYIEPMGLSPQEQTEKANDRMKQLKELADTDDDFWVIGMACVKYGDLCQLAALGNVSDQDRQKLLDTAGGYYRRAIDDFSDRAETVALARLGLGQLDETLGKYDAAKAQYESVKGMTEFSSAHPLVVQADTYLKNLEKVQEPAPMAKVAPPEPETKPETAPDKTTKPETQGDEAVEPAGSEPLVPEKTDEN